LKWLNDFPPLAVKALAYCDNILYASTISDANPAPVLKSSDNGVTWTQIWDGPGGTNGYLSLMVFDSIVIVGT